MKLIWKQIPEQCQNFNELLLQVAVYDLHTKTERCIIILSEDPVPFFDQMAHLTKFCEKHKLPLPLIVTRDFIKYSLDSYPLEFINICSDYINVFDREDVLKNLEYDVRDIRLQMEREFKSKWLHTRLSILENQRHPKAIYEVLHRSLDAILPILKGLFFLSNNLPIPKLPEEIFGRANEMTDFDITILKTMDQVSIKELTPQMILEYLTVLEKLTNLMELWQL
ncbi:MAG: hypothetical protein U1C33_07890 [Candidatus Cloacimonadaceae bacterium]|nr:hypothetical protein [Candidatus Cloacimonadaceae bacterium]